MEAKALLVVGLGVLRSTAEQLPELREEAMRRGCWRQLKSAGGPAGDEPRSEIRSQKSEVRRQRQKSEAGRETV